MKLSDNSPWTIQENFEKNLKAIAILKLFLTKHLIIFKKVIVHGCLKYDVKYPSVTLLVYDSEKFDDATNIECAVILKIFKFSLKSSGRGT